MAIEVINIYTQPQVVAWTNATAVNSTLTWTTAGYSTVTFTVSQTNITAGQLVFELYNGYTWVSVKAARMDDYSTDSFLNLASIVNPHSWQIPVAGNTLLRVRPVSYTHLTLPTKRIV